jgi:hypothetical protein
MRRLRAWTYFFCFIAGWAALSQVPDDDEYVQYSSLIVVFVLSILTVWRWWNLPEGSRTVGFGMGRLPLPARWKRWLYDEPEDR